MTIDIRTRQIGSLFSGETRPAEKRPETIPGVQSGQTPFAETKAGCVRRVARGVSAGLRAASPFAWARILRDRAPDVAGLPDPAPLDPAHPEIRGRVGPNGGERLMEAYARGLHPGAGLGFATWRAPQSRRVARPQDFAIPKCVRGHLRRRELEVTFDRDFDAVLARCALEPARGAWLDPAFARAFRALFDAGLAHSFEVRDAHGALLAGGFGVALGRMFITQAMFGAIDHHVAFAQTILNRRLHRTGFVLHDAIDDARFAAWGFAAMPRADYHAHLQQEAGRALRTWSEDPAGADAWSLAAAA